MCVSRRWCLASAVDVGVRRKQRIYALHSICRRCVHRCCLLSVAVLCCASGSGVQVSIDDRITIEGLQGGEAYNFAVSGEH